MTDPRDLIYSVLNTDQLRRLHKTFDNNLFSFLGVLGDWNDTSDELEAIAKRVVQQNLLKPGAIFQLGPHPRDMAFLVDLDRWYPGKYSIVVYDGDQFETMSDAGGNISSRGIGADGFKGQWHPFIAQCTEPDDYDELLAELVV